MSAAPIKPMTGEMKSDSATSFTFPQFTARTTGCPERIAVAIPTPTTAPTSVCELEAGSPKYHVPRFQMIAPMSSASTIAMPVPGPPAATVSAGSSFKMLIATAIPPTETPRKLKKPDQITATVGLSERV